MNLSGEQWKLSGKEIKDLNKKNVKIRVGVYYE